jgi:multimeric flavodoxin WrbA
MMKIALINGSQKTGVSNSGIILDRINSIINGKHEVAICNSRISLFTDETFKKIVCADVIILAFPLFVYAVPSHTLKMLIELENFIKREKADNLIIYTIVNCGFYEGKQNNVAFRIIENWCEHSGVKFGGGIGQGAGEMLGQTKDIHINKGPFNNLERSLQEKKKKMELKEPFETMYLNPLFPQFLFKIFGTRYWNSMARKNGLKKKDIKRRI